MPRKPLPADWKAFSFLISAENDQYLKELQKAHRRNATQTMVRELEFLRTWGLSPVRVPRLAHAAKTQGATIFQYVTGVLAAHAARLPPAQLPVEVRPSGEKVRSNLNFNGVSQALVRGVATSKGIAFAPALHELLTFARTYNLTRGQYAALEAEAAATGHTVRDLVLVIISDHTSFLPEPPFPSGARSRETLGAT